MNIIIDEYGLGNYPDAFVVNTDSSFIQARRFLLDFKKNNLEGENKTIVVNKYPYPSWFIDIEKEPYIKVEKLLPSVILKNKFKTTSIDPALQEKDIVELNLINQAFDPTENSIVAHYIGALLLPDVNLKEKLFYLSEFAIKENKLFPSSQYLKKKWSKFLDKIDPREPIVKELISRLKELDLPFCKMLNELIYASNAPNLLAEWTHDRRTQLRHSLKLPEPLLEKYLTRSIHLLPIHDQYENRIERYYKTIYEEDPTRFFKEKSPYKAALKAFLSIVKSMTNEEKEWIFSNYAGTIDKEMEEKIKGLIKPQLSPPPDLNDLPLTGQIEGWQNWATSIFIPFKFFLDEFPNPKEIKLAEEYANKYSDWLFKSYSSIIHNIVKTNYNIINTINEELQADYTVIWLIVDGLPAIYANALNLILKNHGINKIEEMYHFAALPTITAIGIPTQLSGRFPRADDYTNDREEALKLAFSNKSTIFENKISKFQDALESEFDICCLHTREIDEFMHKEDRDIDGKRIDEVKRLLTNKIVQIRRAIKANAHKKIKLFISSDHGSTKCLSEGQHINNSRLMEICKDHPKERCVELNSELLKENLDENEIYYLRAEQTLNTSDWAAAKGYRYFGRFDYGYRHGGLTPEETVVPFFICEVAQNEILPIKLDYGGLVDLPLGYTESFKLSVKNDNEAPVEIQDITIIEDANCRLDIKSHIRPLSSATFEGKIKLAKSILVKDGMARLTINIKYVILREKRQLTLPIIVPIKKSANEQLDNLLF